MPAIALYYPWMHFQDDNWVKLALLTWDNLARTRPSHLADRDSELVRQVRAESDLIMEVTPSRRDLDLVTDAFTEILDTDRDRIVERFGHQRDPADDRYRIPQSQVAPPYLGGDQFQMAQSNVGSPYPPAPADVTDRRSFWVYSGSSQTKMGNELRHLLVANDLAIDEPSGGPWVGLRSELASIYLAVLTDAMSQHNALSPATDSPRMHRALGSMDQLTQLLVGGTDRTPALTDATEAYLHLAIQAVLQPEKLAAVPVANIIKFRQRHHAELAAFRSHVAGLGEELARVAAVENLEVANAHLKALYEQQTKPKLDELRRALRGFGVESVAGAMALKIDLSAATGTVLGGIAAAGGQLALAGAAVAVTAVPYVAGRFRARRERATSPVAYLLAADRKLAGGGLLRAMRS